MQHAHAHSSGVLDTWGHDGHWDCGGWRFKGIQCKVYLRAEQDCGPCARPAHILGACHVRLLGGDWRACSWCRGGHDREGRERHSRLQLVGVSKFQDFNWWVKPTLEIVIGGCERVLRPHLVGVTNVWDCNWWVWATFKASSGGCEQVSRLKLVEGEEEGFVHVGGG